MKLIDKDALLAEIERLKAEALQKKSQCKRSGLEKIIHQIGAYNKILSFIDSLEEEPVSEDLEEASVNYAATGEFLPNGKEMIDFQLEKAFRAGAKWKKEQMTAKAGNGRVNSVSNRQTRAHITVAFDSPRDIEVLDRLKVIIIKKD